MGMHLERRGLEALLRRFTPDEASVRLRSIDEESRLLLRIALGVVGMEEEEREVPDAVAVRPGSTPDPPPLPLAGDGGTTNWPPTPPPPPEGGAGSSLYVAPTLGDGGDAELPAVVGPPRADVVGVDGGVLILPCPPSCAAISNVLDLLRNSVPTQSILLLNTAQERQGHKGKFSSPANGDPCASGETAEDDGEFDL